LLVSQSQQGCRGIKDFVFFAVEFDFRAAVLADEHAVALFDFERNFLSVFVGFTGAEGNDNSLSGFFFGGIGDDDAAFFWFPSLRPVRRERGLREVSG